MSIQSSDTGDLLSFNEPPEVPSIVEGTTTRGDVHDFVDAVGRSAALLAGCLSKSMYAVLHPPTVGIDKSVNADLSIGSEVVSRAG
jgi:hypothetical protein